MKWNHEKACWPLRCNFAYVPRPVHAAGRWILVCAVFAWLLLSFGAAAQFLEIGGSPNVVGSGARAMGMGGAFIAVADDATAASWNPGGLTQLERPELSAVYEYSLRAEDYASRRQPGLAGDNDVDLQDLNYLSFVYPVPRPFLGHNIVLSLNYQRRYDFERRLDYRLRRTALQAAGIKHDDERFEYRQRGSLNALSPAIGIELTKRLSIGMAANCYRPDIGHNEWEETFTVRSNHFFGGALFGHAHSEFRRRFRDFSGTNYTFGALWNVTQRLSVGAVYHTRFHASVKQIRSDAVYPTFTGASFLKRERKWRLEFPSAYGAGVAYRFPNDKLTLSFDVTRREWDEFVSIDYMGRRYSPVTGRRKSLSDIDPVYTARLGFEYVFINKSKFVQDYLPSLRGGLVYDPEPASRGVADFYGATFGLGVLVKDRVNVDFAYEFRYGNDVRRDAFTDVLGRSLGNADVQHHRFMLSTVVYF